ncbi:hypothetical protein LZ198_02115 [Myxococcus sp. K15C18031901]|uniref:hypothetical protein n=1 Tax=Myxococcus dinghuensis TaxID=2906761 RepID=UPI0020A7B3A2|nr:hypothetical protein [Myxococcus dinghuensis]MCP3097666.1 hypothetical protein [Myxococcus dinghuensis]
MSLPHPLNRCLVLALSCVALLLSNEARAACEDGQVEACQLNGCLGSRSCEGTKFGPCQFDGSSSTSCSVCGRAGTQTCTVGPADEGGGVRIAGSCSAYRSELCNGCDDDGDGQVDENPTNNGPLTNGSCQSGVGCPGTSVCTSGAFQCSYQVGARVVCSDRYEDRCNGATAACRADGSRGACQPPTPGPEDCNGCDDDYDGIEDNLPGQPTGSLTRECQSGAGVCLGSSQTCMLNVTNGVRYWGACTAPAETCNGADDDCDGAIDENDVCRTDSAVCQCTPRSCAQQGKNCGVIDDGCGWPLDCGACSGSSTCGGDGVPNVCSGACTPMTQTQACQGKCGIVSDGCTASFNCGGCVSPQTCGGGGVENVCGCTPSSRDLACAGKNCGTVPNGCGGFHTCGPTGTCTSPQTCGGSGTPNVCGCTSIPQATACAGKNCGTVSNGCGGTYTCGSTGTCTSPQSCGGGGTPNVCGCTPYPAYEVCGERECGNAPNGCGGLVACGTCPTGMTCKGNGICQGTPGGF